MLRLSRLLLAIALFSLCIYAPAHADPTLISDSLKGWVPAHPTQNFDIRDDTAVGHAEKPSVSIHAKGSPGEDFQGTAQYFDARSYVGKRVRFTAYVKTKNATAGGLWMRIDATGPGQLLGFDNMQDRPIVGSTDWTSYSVVLDVPSGSVRVFYGALLSGNGELWVSDIRVEVVSDDVPVTKPPMAAKAGLDPATLAAIVSQVRSTAFPIAGDDPALSLDDLAPLEQIVGDAHVVALGEGSHGTAEFFNMKDRMLRFLVEKMGFTVFAMEANWSDALAVDDYIKTGRGSARAALDGLGFWTWDTREVLDMIEWMRAYNAAPGRHPMLSFAGFDFQEPAGAVAIVIDYVRRHDAAKLPLVEHEYACFSRSFAEASQPGKAGAACRVSVAKVAALLDTERSQLEKKSSSREFSVTRNAADVVEQAESVNAGRLDRDAAMAKNTEWLVRQRYAGQKIVLWAHNGHVATAAELAYKPMGSHLRQSFGADMVVFGMTFDSGEIRAVPTRNGHFAGSPIPFRVPPAGVGSSESVFHQTDLPRFVLPLRGVPPQSPLGQWLAQPQGIEMIGAGYDQSIPDYGEAALILPSAFDALVYFDISHASRLLPARSGAAPRQVTTHSSAGGVQFGPYWRLGVHGLSSYSGGADASVVRSGRFSVYLRSSGSVAFSDWAAFSQTLDPRPYRGERVRIAGFIKTTDVALKASCWMRVDGANHEQLGGDFMQDRPLRGSTGWQPFAIVLDVPPQSVRVLFGLLLEGAGQMWVDDVTIKAVSHDVPVTAK